LTGVTDLGPENDRQKLRGPPVTSRHLWPKRPASGESLVRAGPGFDLRKLVVFVHDIGTGLTRRER